MGSLEPNYSHTVPGKATFSIIMRDTNEEIMIDLLEEIHSRIQEASVRNNLEYTIEQKSWLKPVSCDLYVQNIIESAIKDLQYDELINEEMVQCEKIMNSETNKKAETSFSSAAAPTTTKTTTSKKQIKRQGYITMPSGAGHDTQNMALLAPAGMIFVPSRDGISHAPEEFTEWQDIEKGANVLLHSVVKLLEQNKEQFKMNTV